jgi:predicted double-glycine peptidase
LRVFARAASVAAVLVLVTVATAGCYRGSARNVSLDDVDRESGWIMVRGLRVIKQESAHDCGAAALAMVLERWGIPDASAEIRRTMPAPAEQGLTAGRLRQFARDKGLRAFVISGAESDLVNELHANRPVLVGLVQRYRLMGDKGLSHYEVMIGINQSTGHVLLLDPGHGLREDALASFDEEWRAAGRVTLVVAPS